MPGNRRISTSDEAALLIKVAGGDTQAFTEIYNCYQPLLATHIFRITRSRELTDEFTQDVFLKIWINRELLAGVGNFKAYLGVVSRNYALNGIRRLAGEQHKLHEWQIQNTHSAIMHPADTSGTDPYTLLDSAIELLPPQQKKVYLLARHSRKSYAEISTELSLSAGTVKRYLQLATENITKQILSQSSDSYQKTLIMILLTEFF